MIALALALLLADVGPTLPAQGPDPVLVQRDERVQRLGRLLRCSVCQGVSIADSPTPMARAQLDQVRELVGENKTDDEIYDSFVDRYGEWALMAPQEAGFTPGLWLLPASLLVLGVMLMLASAHDVASRTVPPGDAVLTAGSFGVPEDLET